MRPLGLRDRGTIATGLPEIFDRGVSGAIRRAVVIGNGCAGAENQCLGLVRALGLYDRHSLYRVTRPRGGINRWLRWLPLSFHIRIDYFISRIRAGSAVKAKEEIFSMDGRPGTSGVLSQADAKQIAAMARSTFEKNGPLLVVASGHDTIPVASSIKQLAPENVFVVQVQHPRSQLERFDLVVTPCHDYYPLTPDGQRQIPFFLRRWVTPREPPGRNVFLTVGALHRADPSALRSAASAWHNKLALLPKPLLVVNIGGPTRNCFYGVDLAKQLTAMLQSVLWSCGSVRISFSRRTPDEVSAILRKRFRSNPKVYIWDGEGPNPHLGHLAWADTFVITADSVSMLSEACSTGKPVYVVGADQCTWKFADFQKSLLERGAVRQFTGKEDISESWTYPPLTDNADAARRVVQDLAKCGWIIGRECMDSFHLGGLEAQGKGRLELKEKWTKLKSL